MKVSRHKKGQLFGGGRGQPGAIYLFCLMTGMGFTPALRDGYIVIKSLGINSVLQNGLIKASWWFQPI